MDETLRITEEATQIRRCIEQLNAGDVSVRGELINIATCRLLDLTARLRDGFQAVEGVRSSEEIFQRASLHLYQSLHDVPIRDVRHFYRVAAIHVRRELIRLCRECQQDPVERPAGAEASDPQKSIVQMELRRLAAFHDCVEGLPQPQREVFELLWYHQMSRQEVADLMGLSSQDVSRLWRSARLCLHDLMVNKDIGSAAGDD